MRTLSGRKKIHDCVKIYVKDILMHKETNANSGCHRTPQGARTKRLSVNHKIAKMTTNNTKTFNNESTNKPERIIVGYTNDQKGKDIRDEDVVRVSNGKWIAQHSTETGTWREKEHGLVSNLQNL
jgi:hypothetical protein